MEALRNWCAESDDCAPLYPMLGVERGPVHKGKHAPLNCIPSPCFLERAQILWSFCLYLLSTGLLVCSTISGYD